MRVASCRGLLLQVGPTGVLSLRSLRHSADPAQRGESLLACLPTWSSFLLCGESLLHALDDLVHLGLRVHVTVPVLLAMQHWPAHDLHLQPSCGSRCSLSRNLQFARKFCLKFLLDLAELGGVPSSAAVNYVYLDRHVASFQLKQAIVLKFFSFTL
jgi:hypothetical protein